MGAGASVPEDGSITQWLEGLSELYRKYAKHFIRDGYEKVVQLQKQRDRGKVAALLDRATRPRVKEGHKNEILVAYDELVASARGTGRTTNGTVSNEGAIAGEEKAEARCRWRQCGGTASERDYPSSSSSAHPSTSPPPIPWTWTFAVSGSSRVRV